MHRNCTVFGCKQSKPQKLFKSFEDFCDHIRFGCGMHNSRLKCQKCEGAGRLIADGEQCDPVEGYKMAQRVKCQICNGTGVASIVQAKDSYLSIIERWQDQILQWEEARKRLLPTLKKLNRKDFKNLGLPYMS